MDKCKVRYNLGAPEKFIHRRSKELFASMPYRTEFQRDFDRILYSKEFRRLSGKTQVFLSNSNDHLRTRLTHTLEVAQISRVIATSLNLNPILAEAIAYGHDVGHTPFGHVGERTLSNIMNGCDIISTFQTLMDDSQKGFKHNLQSLRVTCDLEQTYGRTGLNLTNFTLWGIKHHSNTQWKDCNHRISLDSTGKCYLKRHSSECNLDGKFPLNFYNHYDKWLSLSDYESPAWSFEGLVVAIADEIAQRHHDIEDALFVGIIDKQEILEKIKKLFFDYFDKEDTQIYDRLKDADKHCGLFVKLVSKLIVSFLSKKLINNACHNLNRFIDKNKISSRDVFIKKYPTFTNVDYKDVISYEELFIESEKLLQKYLRGRVLNSFKVQRMDGKGSFLLRGLCKAYLDNPRQLHDSTIYYVFRQFDCEHTKEWGDITKENLGEMRSRIDSPSLKSDTKFQTCLLRGICDHLAGMTDNFAIAEYEKLYG